jgi:hypothetical protein
LLAGREKRGAWVDETGGELKLSRIDECHWTELWVDEVRQEGIELTTTKL